MKKPTCLHPDCTNDAYARGLCMPHYTAARYLVKKKAVTWEQLEKNGKSLPALQGGRRASMGAWFLEKPAR